MYGISYDTTDAIAPQLASGMRTNLNLAYSRWSGLLPAPGLCYRFRPPVSRKMRARTGRPASPTRPNARTCLTKSSCRSSAKNGVEQVLAVTANGSIGYAAFYGATREFPHRYITLRHKNRIVSRWNGPRH